MTPSATYRVQFHAGFPFAAAVPLARYWRRLGVSHLYASPIATSRKGSTHGYDVVDPTRIDPELGGEDGFRALVAALAAEGLGVILDIVPNHLAVGYGDNAWWLDVLQNGRGSAYAPVFDVDWDMYGGKILVPFLGAPYAEALAAGDLKLERRDGRLAVVAYGEHLFPLRPQDQGLSQTDLSGEALHALCERQHWRLAWSRSAGDAINWRRFFNITELAGVRVEEPAVFDALHALPLRLYREGLIQGVRVDHVDGLADPAAYGQRLRQALGPDAYIVVEKILASGETLPADWGVDGTTGYDFLDAVCAVLHDPAGAEPLGALWTELSGRSADFAVEARAGRHEVIDRFFAGQLDACAEAFRKLAVSDVATRDWATPALRRACRRLIEAMDAYRTYGGPSAVLDAATARARIAAGPVEEGAVERVSRWLAGEGPGDGALRADALRRFSQLAAPVAAKAVEDTAFYRYGRLLSRNDVGCDPGRLGEDAAAFLADAAARPPHAMLATATHDHKRGEDARMRLALLSEIPLRWAALAREWSADTPQGMDRGDAAMLHQTLIGAWPLDLAPDDAAGLDAFAERIEGWQLKSLREAKLRTSWSCPDEDYEAVCRAYLRDQLKGERARALHAFVLEIAPAGYAKSLVQTGLRCTLPGVPDLFQGREGLDFSLVDPDNRRPVDYDALSAMLDGPDDGDWRTGASKQRLIARLLALRPQGPLTPVPLAGARAEAALAFRRGSLTVVAALRCANACIAAGEPRPGRAWWGDTRIDVEGETIAAVDVVGDAAFGWRI